MVRTKSDLLGTTAVAKKKKKKRSAHLLLYLLWLLTLLYALTSYNMTEFYLLCSLVVPNPNMNALYTACVQQKFVE